MCDGAGYDGDECFGEISALHLKCSVTVIDQVNGINHLTSKSESHDDGGRSKWNEFGLALTDDTAMYEQILAEGSPYLKDGKVQLVVVFFLKRKMEDQMDLNSANRFFTSMTTNQTNPNDIVTLQISDGAQFQAPLSCLSASSAVFERMFANEMTEQASGIVNVKEFSGAAFHEFLRFVCLGRVESLGECDMELYEVAKVYQVENLKKLCLLSLDSRATEENVAAIVQFAVLHDEDQLFQTCCIKIAW